MSTVCKRTGDVLEIWGDRDKRDVVVWRTIRQMDCGQDYISCDILDLDRLLLDVARINYPRTIIREDDGGCAFGLQGRRV